MPLAFCVTEGRLWQAAAGCKNPVAACFGKEPVSGERGFPGKAKGTRGDVMDKKTMHFQDLSKEAQGILHRDYRKRAGLFVLIVCFGVAAVFLFREGYGMLSLFLPVISVWLIYRYRNRQKQYFAALLDRHCRGEAMAEVYAYRYERGLTGKERKERAALAARACIYSGNRKKALGYCDRADRCHAMYEQMFAAFVADDGEAFNRLWETYLMAAPKPGEKSKISGWYYKSFEKLDIYRDYMDGEYEKFLEEVEAAGNVFTRAELVCLVYKKACLLLQVNPGQAEQAFYYVLDRGGSMECITLAKEQLQNMFLNGQDQRNGMQRTAENQDNLPF